MVRATSTGYTHHLCNRCHIRLRRRLTQGEDDEREREEEEEEERQLAEATRRSLEEAPPPLPKRRLTDSSVLKAHQYHHVRSHVAADIDIPDTCSICLDVFNDDDIVKLLSCHDTHMFHGKCIDTWVTSVEAVCPVCKRNVQ